MGPRTAHGSKKLGRGRGARSLFRPSALALTLAIAAVFCTTLLLPSATDLGGAVTIKSGSGAATSSGSLGLLTSDTGATGVSGQVTLSSGTASSGASGAVGIESGSSASGSRGAISLSVGSGNGAGGTLSADDRGVKNTASFHSFLRSAAQVAQSTGQTAFKASSEKAIAPCSDLDSLTTGSWNDATQSWAPSLCLHNEAVSSQFPSCLNNKTIGFYGDSTLRNIVNEMLKLGKVDGEIKLKTWGQAPDYTLGGGKMPGDSSRGEIKMYWTPSAYHQQPAQIPSRLDRDDVAVVSIGPWDMVRAVLNVYQANLISKGLTNNSRGHTTKE